MPGKLARSLAVAPDCVLLVAACSSLQRGAEDRSRPRPVTEKSVCAVVPVSESVTTMRKLPSASVAVGLIVTVELVPAPLIVPAPESFVQR